MTQERRIGLALLGVFVFLCLLFSVTLDAQVFVPNNTARAATQTAARITRIPPRPTRTPSPVAAPPSPTETPRVIDQSARYAPQTPYIATLEVRVVSDER